ncbi:hypothetical protein K4G98_24335, partial [Mycobacterium tuberculosis]|nr:hypothetical protein [Mycobacterium tuberculosis]
MIEWIIRRSVANRFLVMMAALFVFSLLFRDMPVSELMLSLISLAVASVADGLPAIISIILSLGVQAMA